MAEESYEWRMQQANDGKARSFDLWNQKEFSRLLTVHSKDPITIDEMRRLVSLPK